jgi:hypothetical protein
MRHVINIACYLLVLAGCSLTAWLIYSIITTSYSTTWTQADQVRVARPKITITSPTAEVVFQPMIQILGFFPNEIDTITYDITNAAGINVGQTDWQRKGYVTGQYFDQAKFDRMTGRALNNRFNSGRPRPRFGLDDSAFTTNFFQLYDINLTKGKNSIVIHIRDKRGRQYSTKRVYTLDFSSDKTPPMMTLIWPTNHSGIAGDSFVLNARVDDNNATIRMTIKNANGINHGGDAIVGRDGSVWSREIPISPGSNTVTLVATDAAGNSSTNVFHVRRASVSVTMNRLEPSQLNKPLVNAHGTVSDAACGVIVNGISATVHADGTWDAQAVPVSPTGSAEFKISVFQKPTVSR